MENKKIDIVRTTGDVEIRAPSIDAETNESVWFHMEDSTHKFKMGLGDILSAIRFAEEQGIVPELSNDWWFRVSVLYPQIFESDDEGEIRCVDSKQKLEEMSKDTN